MMVTAYFDYCATHYLVQANHCAGDTDTFQDHEFLREDENGKTHLVPTTISNKIPSTLVSDALKAALTCDEYS